MNDVIFSHNGRVNIYVSAVLEQVVINFRRIRQAAPHCLTFSSYRPTTASEKAPESLACAALPLIGGLQCAAQVEIAKYHIKVQRVWI